MNARLGRWWKQAAALVALVGMDAIVSLPIMGATYRPFSWMSVAPADVGTVYPIIRDAVFDRAGFAVSAQAAPGVRWTLQRSTNLAAPEAWTDIASTTATDTAILLIDTNPVSRAVYYRVRRILGE